MIEVDSPLIRKNLINNRIHNHSFLDHILLPSLLSHHFSVVSLIFNLIQMPQQSQPDFELGILVQLQESFANLEPTLSLLK